MGLLLDTHYVFAIAGSPGRLTRRKIGFLATCTDRLVVSAVSIWEIRLKWVPLHISGDRKGPLGPDQVVHILGNQNIDFLPLTAAHAAASLTVPIPHRDPFDELLLVQAQAEGLRLPTRDPGSPIIRSPREHDRSRRTRLIRVVQPDSPQPGPLLVPAGALLDV